MQLHTNRDYFPSTTNQSLERSLRETKTINLQDEEEFYREFQPELDTKIVIHGWLSNTNSNTVQNIKDQYLRFKKYNVIGKDFFRIFLLLDILMNCFSVAVLFKLSIGLR